MKETGGTANPRVVSELVRAKLLELTEGRDCLALQRHRSESCCRGR